MKNKFRFWCKGTSENKNFSKEGWWTYPNFLLDKYYSNFDVFDCPHFVACQSTGLIDKNGKEIYEGDIIITDNLGCVNVREVVKWENHLSGFHPFVEKNDIEWYDGRWEDFRIEVIGNIFENKDLL